MVDLQNLRGMLTRQKIRKTKKQLRKQRQRYERELAEEREAFEKEKAEMKKGLEKKLEMKPAEIVIPEAKDIRRIASTREMADRLAERIVFHEISPTEVKERIKQLPIEERAHLEGEVRELEDRIIAEKESIGAPLTKPEENFLRRSSREEKAHILHLSKIDVVADRVAVKQKLTPQQEAFYRQLRSNSIDMKHFKKALERAKKRGY